MFSLLPLCNSFADFYLTLSIRHTGHETPRSFGGMHTPGVTQCIAPETANQLLKNGKFFGGDEGALPPVTPINPYLGGRCAKKWTTFKAQSHFSPLESPVLR